MIPNRKTGQASKKKLHIKRKSNPPKTLFGIPLRKAERGVAFLSKIINQVLVYRHAHIKYLISN